MIVYHVCGYGKFRRSAQAGYLAPPVRAWITIQEAERFSKQTGRPIILRLKFTKCEKLGGHKGMAVFQRGAYSMSALGVTR